MFGAERIGVFRRLRVDGEIENLSRGKAGAGGQGNQGILARGEDLLWGQPVPVRRSNALLLEADHIRGLGILRAFPASLSCAMVSFVAERRCPVTVRRTIDQIGATIAAIAAGDPAQEEQRSSIVHSDLGCLALELDRVP